MPQSATKKYDNLNMQFLVIKKEVNGIEEIRAVNYPIKAR